MFSAVKSWVAANWSRGCGSAARAFSSAAMVYISVFRWADSVWVEARVLRASQDVVVVDMLFSRVVVRVRLVLLDMDWNSSFLRLASQVWRIPKVFRNWRLSLMAS